MGKLSCDAVVCDANRNWYYGRLNGFQFNIVKRLKSKEDLNGVDRYKSAAKFIKSIGYDSNYQLLTRQLMKNIKINDWKSKKHNSTGESSFVLTEIGKGATRLFLTNINKNDIKNHILCGQCYYSCKQAVDSGLLSCAAFKMRKE